MKHVIVICALLCTSSPSFGEKNYFDNLDQRLQTIEKDLLFFQESVCPKQKFPTYFEFRFREQREDTPTLHALLFLTRAMYEHLDGNELNQTGVLQNMEIIRKQIMHLEEMNRSLEDQYAN